jgi:hypothetical protein
MGSIANTGMARLKAPLADRVKKICRRVKAVEQKSGLRLNAITGEGKLRVPR